MLNWMFTYMHEAKNERAGRLAAGPLFRIVISQSGSGTFYNSIRFYLTIT